MSSCEHILLCTWKSIYVLKYCTRMSWLATNILKKRSSNFLDFFFFQKYSILDGRKRGSSKIFASFGKIKKHFAGTTDLDGRYSLLLEKPTPCLHQTHSDISEWKNEGIWYICCILIPHMSVYINMVKHTVAQDCAFWEPKTPCKTQ